MNDLSHNNWTALSNKVLSQVIGKFIQHHRLSQNKTQDQIAEEAGLSRSTLSLLERGEKVHLNSLIQALRALNLLYVMDVFQVSEEISPLEYAKLKKKQRKQASPKSSNQSNNEDLGW